MTRTDKNADMFASTQFTDSSAFILRDESLSKLVITVNRYIGNAEIVCKCADGIQRHFNDVESLAHYENVKTKEIQSLAIRARSSDPLQTASIRLGKRPLATIDVELSGLVTAVEDLRDEVIDILHGTKAWYSILTKINFIYALFGLLIVLVYGVDAAMYFDILKDPSPESSPSKHSQGFALFIVCGVFLVGWLLNKIREKIFPTSLFLIGQGKNRHALLEKFQWGVVVSFLVSIATSLVLR